MDSDLVKALKWGHKAKADKILEKWPEGRSVSVSCNGTTPLHEAAKAGNEAVVRRLLAMGADASIVDGKGQTAVEALKTQISEKGEAGLGAVLKLLQATATATTESQVAYPRRLKVIFSIEVVRDGPRQMLWLLDPPKGGAGKLTIGGATTKIVKELVGDRAQAASKDLRMVMGGYQLLPSQHTDVLKDGDVVYIVPKDVASKGLLSESDDESVEGLHTSRTSPELKRVKRSGQTPSKMSDYTPRSRHHEADYLHSAPHHPAVPPLDLSYLQQAHTPRALPPPMTTPFPYYPYQWHPISPVPYAPPVFASPWIPPPSPVDDLRRRVDELEDQLSTRRSTKRGRGES